MILVKKYNEEKIPESAIAISPNVAKSEEEILLAYELAKRAFDRGYNIAKKFKLEFLLWLAGKTDIKSALETTAPQKGKSALVIVFGKEKIDGEKKAKIKKEGNPLDLERISLSRVKN
ncbi:MAG: KEOPS complex subunit Cgi121 [Candidatus Bilamarchaeaceae archaeon]